MRLIFEPNHFSLRAGLQAPDRLERDLQYVEGVRERLHDILQNLELADLPVEQCCVVASERAYWSLRFDLEHPNWGPHRPPTETARFVVRGRPDTSLTYMGLRVYMAPGLSCDLLAAGGEFLSLKPEKKESPSS